MSEVLRAFATRIALITGGAGVLGSAICHAFSAAGATVIVADVDDAAAQQLARQIGAAAMALHLDVASPADWEQARAVILARYGRLDVLVNNAGTLKAATIEDATLEDWQETMRVNGDGTFLGCKFGVSMLKNHGGAIVNISSVMGLRGVATHPAYCASKAAVRLLTRSVALHCGQQGYRIRVNAVLPGAIDSDMVRRNVPAGGSEAEYLETVRARHPIGRLGTADEVAAAVLFACSDQASFMTGSDLVIDGGSAA